MQQKKKIKEQAAPFGHIDFICCEMLHLLVQVMLDSRRRKESQEVQC